MTQTGVGSTTYGYDNANRLTSVTNPYSEATSYTYDNANRATRQTFSSGAYDTFGYDTRSRQTSVSHKNSGGTVLSSESYSYDNAGNLSSKTVDSVTTTYGYDNIDQLTSESRTGYSASYTYDANGNRSTKTLGGVTDTYTNDNGDKLTSVALGGGGTKSFGYDSAGRTTSVTTGAGTTTLSYDYESRVTGITYPGGATNSFTYNGLDTRVGKVDSSGTKSYMRDGVGVTDPVLSDSAAVYTPGVSERRSGATKFYLGDRLGTNTAEADTTQAITATKTYDAFGLLVSSTGTSSSPFGFVGKAGYQEDGDSGLKLLGHRYYDASTGRFLTRDKLWAGENWYVYVSASPNREIDPDGMDGQEPGEELKGAEHTKGARESTRGGHENGKATKRRDQLHREKKELNGRYNPNPRPKNPVTQPGKDSDSYLKGPKRNEFNGPDLSGIDPVKVGVGIIVVGALIIFVIALPEVAVPVLGAGAL